MYNIHARLSISSLARPSQPILAYDFMYVSRISVPLICNDPALLDCTINTVQDPISS